MTIADIARPEIRGLRPYDAAVQIGDTVRLNANEAPWNDDADRFRRPLNRYPEIRPAALRGALARRFGCDTDRLLVTRGTSEAIDLLIRVFCRPGRDNIVTTAPTFSNGNTAITGFSERSCFGPGPPPLKLSTAPGAVFPVSPVFAPASPSSSTDDTSATNRNPRPRTVRI